MRSAVTVGAATITIGTLIACGWGEGEPAPTFSPRVDTQAEAQKHLNTENSREAHSMAAYVLWIMAERTDNTAGGTHVYNPLRFKDDPRLWVGRCVDGSIQLEAVEIDASTAQAMPEAPPPPPGTPEEQIAPETYVFRVSQTPDCTLIDGTRVTLPQLGYLATPKGDNN